MNLKLKIFLSITFTIIVQYCAANLFAQQPTQEWLARYDGPSHGNETAKAMAIDSLGNVYISGIDGESPPGFVTIKYNSSGQLIWSRRYYGMMPTAAQPVKIGVDFQNNIYVAGTDQDYILIKYNSNGAQQWVRRYNLGTLNDMVITNDGKPIVSGTITRSTNDCCTIKYMPNGDTLWTAIYDSQNNGHDRSFAVSIGPEGEVAITGNTVNPGIGNQPDFLTIKYDSNGIQSWVQRYDHSVRWDYAVEVSVNNSGSIYVLGRVQVDGNNEDYCTIKYSANGSQLWVKTYDGTAHSTDEPEQLLIDHTGSIIIAGNTLDSVTSRNFCTIKYDSLGNLLWFKTYNGFANDADLAEDAFVDNSNNIYIVGEVIDSTSAFGGTYGTTVKYDSTGNLKWTIKYIPPINNSGTKGVIVDKIENIYLLAQDNLYNAGNNDLVTFKYSQPIGIEPISNETPFSYKLYQNYPNPFNPSTTIKYEVIKSSSHVSLIVYDITGRSITNLVDEKQNKGVYEISFNSNMLSSGIYFYRLTVNGSIIDTKKMILVK